MGTGSYVPYASGSPLQPQLSDVAPPVPDIVR